MTKGILAVAAVAFFALPAEARAASFATPFQQQQPDAAALVKAALDRWAPLASQVSLGAVSSRQEGGKTVASGVATVFGVQAQVAAAFEGAAVRTLRLSFPQSARLTSDRVRDVIGTDLAAWLPTGLTATASLDRIEVDFQGTTVSAARVVMAAGTWAAVSDDLLKLSHVETSFTVTDPTGRRTVAGALEGRLDLPAQLMQMIGMTGTYVVVRSELSPQPGAITLSAAIATGVKLDGGGKIVIQDARIELSTKPSRPGLALAGKMSIDAGGTPLVFQTDVAIDVRGKLFAEGWMEGKWDNPFGISRSVSVQDLGVGVGVNFAGALPILAFQGGLRIGDIQGAVTLGLDPANPANSMIDARLGNLTLFDVVKAFGGGQAPPGISSLLATIGVNDVRLKVVPPGPGVDLFGVHHAPGFLAHGILQFIGVGGEVLISIDETGVEALAAVSKIQFPGFSMTSANDPSRGPYIYVVSKPSRSEFAFVVNGSLDVLGIRSTTDIYLSDAGFSATLSGQLMGAFGASLEVAGDNIFTGGSLWVKAEMQNDLLGRINSVGSQHAYQAVMAAQQQSNQAFNAEKASVANATLIVPPSLSCEDKSRRLAALNDQRAEKQRRQRDESNALGATAAALGKLVKVGTQATIGAIGSFVTSGGSTKAAEAAFNSENDRLTRRKNELTTAVNQLGREIESLTNEINRLGAVACGGLQTVTTGAVGFLNTGTRAVAIAGLDVAQGLSSGTLQASAWLARNGNPAQLLQISRASGTMCLSAFATSQMTLSVEGVFAGQPVSSTFVIDLAHPDPGINSLADQFLDGGAVYGSGAPCARPDVPRPSVLQGDVGQRIARLSGGGKPPAMQVPATARPVWAGVAPREPNPITVLARELASGAATIPAASSVSLAGAPAIGTTQPSIGGAPAAPVLRPAKPTDGLCGAAVGVWAFEPDYVSHQITLDASGKWSESNGAQGNWRCDDAGGWITILGLGAEPQAWSIPPQGGMIDWRVPRTRPVALPVSGQARGSAALFGGSRTLVDAVGCCKPGRMSLSPAGMSNFFVGEDQDFAIGTSPLIFDQVNSDQSVKASGLFIRPAVYTIEGVSQGVTIQSARDPNFMLGYVGSDAAMLSWNPYWDVFKRVVSFRVQPGLSGRGVSFESVGRPGAYLFLSDTPRDQRLRIGTLEDTPDFKRRASFDLAVDPSVPPPAMFDPPRKIPGTNALGLNTEGQIGAAAGNAWISQCDLRPESVAGIRLFASDIIHSLGLWCRNHAGSVVPANFDGRAVGNYGTFMLEKDERITAVSGSYGGMSVRYITALQFHTNRRSSPVFGSLAGGQTPFRFDVPAGLSFGGFQVNFIQGALRHFGMYYAYPPGTPTEVIQSPTYRMEQAQKRSGVPGVIEEVRRLRAAPATASMSLEYSFRQLWLTADDAKDLPTKRAIAEAWVQDAPESWFAHLQLSGELLASDVPASVMHAEKALALAPNNALTTFMTLEAYKGDRTKSIARLDSMIAAKPNDAWPLTARAVLEGQPTAREEAWLETAIKLDTAAWLPRVLLATLFATTKTDDAIRLFRQALTLNPWAESYVNTAGYAAIERKDIPLAIRYFELVVDVRPFSWNGHDSLAEALALAGQKPRAIEEYEKSISLNPENSSGRKKLAALKGVK